MAKIAILIMAAGNSSRLGRAKQLLSYKTQTLLQYTIGECLQAKLGEVHVILGGNAKEILPSIQGLCPVHFNPEWNRGLGNSIAFGAKQIIGKSLDGLIIVLGDQPFFSKDILAALYEKLASSKAPIILSQYKNGQGPPTYFSESVLAELCTLDGDDGAKAIVKKYRETIERIPFEKGEIDIDKPEDLKWLK